MELPSERALRLAAEDADAARKTAALKAQKKAWEQHARQAQSYLAWKLQAYAAWASAVINNKR